MQATAEWLDVDFYEVLGVDRNASKKKIRSAYRKLARSAHPDANPDDGDADARFSRIAKAYEVLGDEDTRADYDELRARAAQPTFGTNAGRWPGAPSSPGGYADISDLFGDLFAEQQTRPRQGADISASLGLDFIDAVQGLTTALVVDGRSIKVRIPAGVRDQQTIRLRGQGAAGANGGPAGDLLIQITVSSHPTFGRSGRNLTTTAKVRYEDMVLGGEVAVPTLDGSAVIVRIPPGSPDGQKLRVKGKGVPVGDRHGDLVVTVVTDVPTDTCDEERALLERLRSFRQAA